MSIAKITRPGLAGIGVSVAFLWGCLIGEHIMVQRAISRSTQALRELELLRQRQFSRPVSAPEPPLPRPFRAIAG
ncbi:MAG TPA: hypothetical protein VJ732_04685 [Bryobacteraceae bacterium]|nr:hypothetical protein [Bryobacteraceae bacterium]